MNPGGAIFCCTSFFFLSKVWNYEPEVVATRKMDDFNNMYEIVVIQPKDGKRRKRNIEWKGCRT